MDAMGRPLPLASIREISVSWSQEIWDAYLETLEGAQSEYLPSREIDRPVSAEENASEKAGIGISTPVVKVAMAELPSLQQAVIESLLVNRISERSAAALYGVTRWRLRSLKRRALQNLQARIDNAVLPGGQSGTQIPLIS